MFDRARKTIIAVAALAALALGGAVIADAASKGSTTQQGSSAQQGSAAQQTPPPNGGPPPGAGPRNGGPPPGRHIGANGQREQPLASDVAAKVKAAALAKEPGATVERVETDVDFGSPYEAHVRTSDGRELSVLVNQSFEVTAVKAMMHP